jgi:tetratricopeptide (TPR) repeat protein
MAKKISVPPNRDELALQGQIEALRQRREFDAAAALIEQALAQHQKKPLFLVELGWLAMDRQQHEKALSAFDDTLAADAGHEGALQGKCAALRKLGDYGSALLLVERALDLYHPRSPGLLAERGWIWLEQEDHAKAAEAFAKALEVRQPDDSIYLWQLFLLRELDRWEEAEKVFRKAEVEFPESSRLQTERGWMFFHQGHLEAATNQFQSVLNGEPKLATALQGKIASLRVSGALDDADYELIRHADVVAGHLGLMGEKGWVAFAREDFVGAERAFRNVVSHLGGDHLAMVHLAWALVRQGGRGALLEAADLCRQSLLSKPTAEAMGCLGVASFKLGKPLDAERHLKASIEVDPLKGHHADLAALYVYMVRHDDAEKVLTEGLQLKPWNVQLHLESANLHMQRKKPEAALDCYSRVLRLEPKNLDGVCGLAIVRLATGRAVEAESVIREGLGWAGGDRRVHLLLILSRALVGRFDETGDADVLAKALNALHQTRQLRQPTAESYFQEGVVQARLGNHQEAMAAFVECQRLDASRTEAGVNASSIRLHVKGTRPGLRFAEMKSWLVALLLVLQLGALWYLRMQSVLVVTDTMLTVLVPICLGLVIVAFLMPSLSKFSVTGVAVELAEAPSTPETKGPKGIIVATEAMTKAGPAI